MFFLGAFRMSHIHTYSTCFFHLSLLVPGQVRTYADFAYTSRESICVWSVAGLGTLCTWWKVTPFHSCLPVESVMHTSPNAVPVFKLALTWYTAILLPGFLMFWIDEGPWAQPCWVQGTGCQSPCGSYQPSGSGASYSLQPRSSSFLLSSIMAPVLLSYLPSLCVSCSQPPVCEDLIPMPNSLSEISSRRHHLGN